jgi:acyl carrier protein
MLTVDQVRKIIAGACPNVDAFALHPDAVFEDEGMDSLDHASILLALQEKYGWEVSDEVAAEMTSISAIVNRSGELKSSANG